jgi:PadR family transcriptional regulator PadR
MMNNKLGVLDQHLMLAVFRLRPSAYGVAIQQLIRDRAKRSYSIGAIYAGLDRLEEKGFLRSKTGDPTAERGGRAKLYFDLTASGQRALSNSLQALDVMRSGLSAKEAFA